MDNFDDCVVQFKVFMAVAFYDVLSEKLISPTLLSFYSNERQIKPTVKENSFAVFTNLDKSDKQIKVTSAFYADEIIEISKSQVSPEQVSLGNVIYISLYPSSEYPKRQNYITLSGEEKNLIALNLIAVKKSLWLKFSDYKDYKNESQTIDNISNIANIAVENLFGNYIPTEIGLYIADKKDFYTAKLKKMANGRCEISGNFTQEALLKGIPVKLYKAQVKASGEFFLLADKTDGNCIASFQYAKKTVWKNYIENGEKLVMAGGG